MASRAAPDSVADDRYDLAWTSGPRLAQLAAERFGSAPALVEGDTRWTFAELAREILRGTRAALAAGIRPGDRIAIWAPNSREWIVAALGAQGAGATLVPVNTRFRAGEAAHVIRTSKAKLLFTVNGFLNTDYEAMLRGSGEDLPGLAGIVLLRGAPIHAGTRTWEDYLDGASAVPETAARDAIAAVKSDDFADIIFTSGTTGRPKGVPTTHGQNLRCFGIYTKAIGLAEGDRYLIANPFFHCFGYKAGFVACLMRGATMFPVPKFDAEHVVRLIEEHAITVLPGPPTLLQSVLEQKGDRNLSSLRLTCTGAADIPIELIRKLRAAGMFDIILTAYGLTESSGVVSVSHADDPPEIISRWSGRAINNIEVRIVDSKGSPLPVGEIGEILVRGFNVMQGYLDDPAMTAATIDSDGWLHTGDLGIRDEEGRLRITGRKKDMFIVGGFNAYPAEIEDILLRHDAIAEVAVIGIPDERLGEVGAAFVVPASGRSIEAAELIGWARANMANYKAPRRVYLLDRLPVNAAGKVDKIDLRARASDALHI